MSILFGYCAHASADNIYNLRNQRYCEILLGNKRLTFKNVAVYNTIGLNQCPPELWRKENVKTIKKQTGAAIVHFNGPRYWVIDSMEHSNLLNSKPVTLGGIPMRKVAVLKMKLLQYLGGQKPYQLHTVYRQTTYVYDANKPIYELTDPQKRVFIMQSYSTEKAPQNLTSLAKLNTRLQLPPGWRFSTRILKNKAALTPVNRIAIITQDNLLNTYEQETPNFLTSSLP